MRNDLLIELLTEELPPKVLPRLMEAFSRGVYEGLKEKNFLAADADPRPFATPRRLAVLVSHVLDKQADRIVERKGPAAAAGLDADGKPTPALAGFARSCGVDVAKLERRAGDKGEYFVYRAQTEGRAAQDASWRHRRDSAEEAACPQAHALGRGRGAVCAPGAWRDATARQQSRARVRCWT